MRFVLRISGSLEGPMRNIGLPIDHCVWPECRKDIVHVTSEVYAEPLGGRGYKDVLLRVVIVGFCAEHWGLFAVANYRDIGEVPAEVQGIVLAREKLFEEEMGKLLC